MTVLLFIHVVLALVVLEALAVALLAPRFTRVPRRALLATIAAGAALLLALRAVALGAGLVEVMLWLSLALVAHVVDLGMRFYDEPRN